MRGIQRRVVYIKNTGSRMFDEAMFFINREGFDFCDEDVTAEADRIIGENIFGIRHKKIKRIAVICTLVSVLCAVSFLLGGIFIK